MKNLYHKEKNKEDKNMSIIYLNENFYSNLLENTYAYLALDEAAYMNDVVLSVDAMARA